jgi:hypothetical protein
VSLLSEFKDGLELAPIFFLLDKCVQGLSHPELCLPVGGLMREDTLALVHDCGIVPEGLLA